APPLELADISFTINEISARYGAMLLRAHYLVDAAHVHVWLGAEHFDFLLDDPRDREYSSTAARGGLRHTRAEGGGGGGPHGRRGHEDGTHDHSPLRGGRARDPLLPGRPGARGQGITGTD